MDITNYSAVEILAKAAAAAGHIDAIVNTAGISPMKATSNKIFEVVALGFANIIDAFYAVASAGTSFVGTSSLASYLVPPGVSQQLLSTNISTILSSTLRRKVCWRIQFLNSQINIECQSRHEHGEARAPESTALVLESLRLKWATSSWKEQVGNVCLLWLQDLHRVERGLPKILQELWPFSLDQTRLITGNDILVDGGV